MDKVLVTYKQIKEYNIDERKVEYSIFHDGSGFVSLSHWSYLLPIGNKKYWRNNFDKHIVFRIPVNLITKLGKLFY